MQIVVDNIEQFATFFNVVYDMSSELLELQLFQDRMVCSLLDRTKTRFFHVVYDADFFDVYDIDDVSSVVVFVEDLHKLLKSVNKKDVLFLEVNDPYLVAKIESVNGNSRIFEFVLPTDFMESPVPPHADFPVKFEVGVGDLETSVKDIGVIGSDLFTFNVGDDNLTITTSTEIATKYANIIPISLENLENVSASFTLDYVEQMLKFKKISKTVELKIGQDLPIFYEFNDEIMGVKVIGMIAPRISEEE